MTIRQLFASLLVVALFVMGVHETLDPDMWWHLRTGQLVWESGIPFHDPFSFTMLGRPWTAHEWLSDAIMWAIYQFGGFPVLILSFAGLAAVAHWLVYRRSVGRPYLAGFVVLLSALASAPFWGVRPQMFNILLAALFIFIVEGVRAGQVGRRVLLLLPLLTALWANLHSGYLLGVVLLGAYTVGEAGERLLTGSALPWRTTGWLGGATAASFLAALANPHGYRLWIYPFETLGSPSMQRFIAEWKSPDFHQPHFWFFAGLMGLGVLSWVLSERRPSLTDLLLFLGLAAAGLLSSRHIPLFALVAPPIICRHLLAAAEGTRLQPILSGDGRLAKRRRPLALLNVALLIVTLLATAVYAGQRLAGNDMVVATLFPVAAVDYLEESGLDDGRLFNDYNWGGYLIWRGLPVFVDGRADLYGDDFLFAYLDAYTVKPAWQRPLDQYAIDAVLMPHNAPLSVLLATSDDWRQVYADELARIFVRQEAE